ncbi:TetR/AcrR family transcriptional regulator [Actinomadura barringtoniae]|uniref:TetR/AcrR family transcriptional regulator n=1 Tax=Actinomadura barringtoniae TaxID=1427535 RepID=A0A939PG08_9ACTN|nr:TetR/AcrR family transcriptional regulator [Actinomadura barringtoniae]MBO2447826.1 TetR/AcrR family transcriptional regulator [Actinomadura barringtoniae]
MSDSEVPVRQEDLSTYARIRNAALQGFAAKGVAATSIRDVAAAAGVSPGLVQHHFGTKSGLREAVDEYVIAVAVETFRDLVRDGAVAWDAMGDTVTSWVGDNATAVRYLARGLAEGDEGAAKIFDALIEIAGTRWLDPLDRDGRLRTDTDRDWAAIHVVLFNLACVFFEPAISRHLPGPFFSPDQLQRWNTATTELYRRGLST